MSAFVELASMDDDDGEFALLDFEYDLLGVLYTDMQTEGREDADADADVRGDQFFKWITQCKIKIGEDSMNESGSLEDSTMSQSSSRRC